MFKTFLTIFATVFIAEIGDKTQLATMLFAAEERGNRWLVFAASALALTLAAAIGVMAGAVVERYVSPRMLKMIAGAGFVIIGVWTMVSK